MASSFDYMSAPSFPDSRTLTADLAAEVSSRSGAPVLSLRFLAAANVCKTASDLPHPVHARNAELVVAWRQWAAWRYQAADANYGRDLLVNLSRRYEENVALIEKDLRTDPVWRFGVLAGSAEAMSTTAMTVAAPLMFWTRPHAVMELTQPLEQWLAQSDLGEDVPVGLLRPPQPACFIRFGPELQSAVVPTSDYRQHGIERLQGVYVFEAVRDCGRTLALIPIFEAADAFSLVVESIELVIEDETLPLVETIQRLVRSDTALSAHFQSIAKLCVMVFLYGGLAQAVSAEETPYSAGLTQVKHQSHKQVAKQRRRLSQVYDRIVLGPHTLSAEMAAGTHAEVAAHWRRGHFRMQPHGPQLSLRKLIFVAPTLVRADRLVGDELPAPPRSRHQP